MLIRLMEDLRFVIGVFFAILSCILAFVGANPNLAGGALDLQVAGLMGIFAAAMIGLALRDAKR